MHYYPKGNIEKDKYITNVSKKNDRLIVSYANHKHDNVRYSEERENAVDEQQTKQISNSIDHYKENMASLNFKIVRNSAIAILCGTTACQIALNNLPQASSDPTLTIAGFGVVTLGCAVAAIKNHVDAKRELQTYKYFEDNASDLMEFKEYSGSTRYVSSKTAKKLVKREDPFAAGYLGEYSVEDLKEIKERIDTQKYYGLGPRTKKATR